MALDWVAEKMSKLRDIIPPKKTAAVSRIQVPTRVAELFRRLASYENKRSGELLEDMLVLYVDKRNNLESVMDVTKCAHCGVNKVASGAEGHPLVCPNVFCCAEPKAVAQPGSLAGWVCPRCKGGVSPYAARCPCTPQSSFNYNIIMRTQNPFGDL